MSNKAIHFPGLNGLRAIAAISVVISHITLALNQFGLDPHIFGDMKDGNPKGFYLGGYGVSIFFTLSGFLITYLLEAEKDQHPINIKKFYIRRILRIWPLYYAYLALSVITIFIFKLDFNSSSFLLYFFYCANIPSILHIMLPFLNHYWSLGVEEQFYLFWPWVIKKLKTRITWVIGIAIAFLLALKLAAYVIAPHSILTSTLIITRFHCMMIGGLAAILYRRKHSLFLKITGNKIAQVISWSIIVLSALNRFQVASILDDEIISCVAVFLIIGQIDPKKRIINLENKVCDFLGKISYGIYVIHLLVIFYFSKIFGGLQLTAPYKYLLVYFGIVGSTIIIAYLSYEYFEKYFLSLKKKYTVVESVAQQVGSKAVQTNT